jgi:hypothetical protein
MTNKSHSASASHSHLCTCHRASSGNARRRRPAGGDRVRLPRCRSDTRVNSTGASFGLSKRNHIVGDVPLSGTTLKSSRVGASPLSCPALAVAFVDECRSGRRRANAPHAAARRHWLLQTALIDTSSSPENSRNGTANIDTLVNSSSCGGRGAGRAACRTSQLHRASSENGAGRHNNGRVALSHSGESRLLVRRQCHIDDRERDAKLVLQPHNTSRSPTAQLRRRPPRCCCCYCSRVRKNW